MAENHPEAVDPVGSVVPPSKERDGDRSEYNDESGSNTAVESVDLERGNQQSSSKEEASDPYLVSWDGDGDKDNPYNWPVWKRVYITAIWIFANIVTTIASSIFASGSAEIQQEFGVSPPVATLGVSLFLVGYAVGPPVWGPLSERFGRRRPMIVGLLAFTLFCLPVTLGRNIQTVLVGRFLCGTFGVAPLAVFGGGIVDMWASVHRGVAMASCIGSIFGTPVIAPVIGNFVAASYLGWRWTNWLSAIMGLACSALVLVGLPETYAPTILRARAARLRKDTGNLAWHSRYDDEKKDIRTVVNVYLVRPFVMLALEPILSLITLYHAFIYGLLYLVFTSYPVAFREVRGWALGVSGLAYLGMFVGILLGAATVIAHTRTSFARNMAASGGVLVPEDRLPMMIVGGCILPVGLFIFAWTSDPDVHWMGMQVGSVLVGMGMYMIFVQCVNYIVDVYLSIANSALGANTFVRSFFGAAFPLFGPYMYRGLGVDWATSVLAFVAIAMVPIPVLFYKYGARVRAWSKMNQNPN